MELKEVVSNFDEKLAEPIRDGAGVFSVGQKQLVCLARAILKKNKIIVLDEATANVDLETDSVIQETIKRKFSECTVVTVAHRLETVIDSDRIIVMDKGEVIEFDQPHKLLQKGGHFASMVEATGKERAALLREKAHAAYLTQHK